MSRRFPNPNANKVLQTVKFIYKLGFTSNNVSRDVSKNKKDTTKSKPSANKIPQLKSRNSSISPINKEKKQSKSKFSIIQEPLNNKKRKFSELIMDLDCEPQMSTISHLTGLSTFRRLYYQRV